VVYDNDWIVLTNPAGDTLFFKKTGNIKKELNIKK
jgi:hypothetical protein